MKSWLKGHFGVVLAVLLGIALSLPAFGGGMFSDDYTHRVGLRGDVPGFKLEPWAMYDFAPGGAPQIHRMMETGGIPWWVSEDFSVRFHRPLASLTLAADTWIFGSNMVGAHAHSLLWFCACILLVYALLRRLSDPRTAGLATVLYAVAGCHVMPVFWVAARHAYVAAAIGLTMLLGLAMHLVERRRNGLWLALGALVLGLLAGGEAFVGSVLFALVLIAWCGKGKTRWTLLSIWAGALTATMFAYDALGFGVKDSGIYLDPLGNPFAFAAAAWKRGLALYADALLSLPSVFYQADPRVQPVLTGVGLVAGIGLGGVLRWLRNRLEPATKRHLPWLLMGATASLIPGLAGSLGGRMLAVGMAGFALALASVALAAWEHVRQGRGVPRVAAAVVLLVLAGSSGLLSPLLRIGITLEMNRMADELARVAKQSNVTCAKDAEIVLVATDDIALGGHLAFVMLEHNQGPLPWTAFRVLSAAPNAHRVTTIDERTIELTTLGEDRQPGFWESVYRSTPPQTGHRIRAGAMNVQIVESGEGGWTRARFQWDAPLTAEHACFYRWDGKLVTPFALPPMGASKDVEQVPGPMSPRE